MKYTKLGRTGVKVSRLCLGTGNFGYNDDFVGSWAATGENRVVGVLVS